MSAYAQERLLRCIQRMREVCDEAERDVNHPTASILTKANRVHHIFAWGWANASVDIESAIADTERQIEMKRLIAEEPVHD